MTDPSSSRALTISVLQSKGGVGKSTTAIHLAGALSSRPTDEADHSRVLLVDTDAEQHSARDWASLTDTDLITVVGLDNRIRPRLERDIKALAGDMEFVVIDGSAHLQRMDVSAIIASDIVLIPVQPSAFDVWPVRRLVEVIENRQQVSGGTPVAAFVVVQEERTKEAKVIEEMIDYGLPVLPARIQRRQVYKRSIGTGYTVFDYEAPRNEREATRKAQEEMSQLAEEVIQLATSIPSRTDTSS